MSHRSIEELAEVVGELVKSLSKEVVGLGVRAVLGPSTATALAAGPLGDAAAATTERLLAAIVDKAENLDKRLDKLIQESLQTGMRIAHSTLALRPTSDTELDERNKDLLRAIDRLDTALTLAEPTPRAQYPILFVQLMCSVEIRGRAPQSHQLLKKLRALQVEHLSSIRGELQTAKATLTKIEERYQAWKPSVSARYGDMGLGSGLTMWTAGEDLWKQRVEVEKRAKMLEEEIAFRESLGRCIEQIAAHMC